MQKDLVAIAKKCKETINSVNKNFSETEIGQKQLLNYFLRTALKNNIDIEITKLNEAAQILTGKKDKVLVNKFEQFFKERGIHIIYE